MKKLMTSAMAAVLLGTTVIASVGTASADPRRDAYIESYYRDRDRDDDYRRWERDRRSWRDDDYRRWYRDRHRGDDFGDAGAAALFGLAAGAIIGGAIGAATNDGGGVVVSGDADWIRACSDRYRSFDPSSGTYLGYDGQRHPCRL
jgi:hypothetical protein